jgi:hypothetical protein
VLLDRLRRQFALDWSIAVGVPTAAAAARENRKTLKTARKSIDAVNGRRDDAGGPQ